MAEAEATVDLNRPAALIAISFLGIVGASVFIVQPGFVQGLVSLAGLTEAGAGYVATSEMAGLALSTILLSFMSGIFNWRRMLFGGVALMAVGNAASIIFSGYEALLGLRFIAGVGSGILVSLSFGAIGLTRHVDRNFGIYMSAVLTYGAIGLFLMPGIFAAIGFSGLFVLLLVMTVAAVPAVGFMPVHAREVVAVSEKTVDLPGLFRGLALAAMFAYFLAQGAVWAYLFLIGLEGGLGEGQVSTALMISQFAGVGGALTTTVLGDRAGRLLPLAIGIISGILSLVVLQGTFSFLVYMLGVGVFNFMWNMVHPFLMASMSGFDRRGKMVIYAVSMQVVGLALGPGVAASFIDVSGYRAVYVVSILSFAASLCFIVPPLIKWRNMLKVRDL